MMEKNHIEESHIQNEKDISTQIFNLSGQEENLWRLKFRSIWLKVGDSNTSYFHKQIVA